MKKFVFVILSASAFVLISTIFNLNVQACSRIKPFSFDELFVGDQIIVRATAVKYAKTSDNPQIITSGKPDSIIEFKVEERLRGENIPDKITLNGYLSEKDDYNELPVPYKFVRPNGRRGSCFANTYKEGGQFLLFLKRTGNDYTTNISALGPTNEQLRSEDDAWLIWVRNYLKSSEKSENTSGIYIPADKRHQGLSRFDLLPFTDRKKGDVDRYRAINPNYVVKEDGNYYYSLNVKQNSHYFDENFNDKGIVPATGVKIDFVNSKSAKSSDDVTRKYVYAKGLGYVLTTSLTVSGAEIKKGKWFRFPLKEGENMLYDGTGILRGKIVEDSVKLNYGQQKEIGGERYYYAFSTQIILSGAREKIGASGWIKASALKPGNDPQYSAETVEKMQPAPTVGATFTDYEITGGNPLKSDGTDATGKPKYKFGYTNGKGEFSEYKVLPGVAADENVASTDYLKRSDEIINLGFNAAGVSNDTFRIKGENRPLIFHRSADKEATVMIDLFYPKEDSHDGTEIAGKMIFVYGYVDTPSGKRWGWIPLDALKSKS